MSKNLSEQTPVEIDTRLADLHWRAVQADRYLAFCFDDVHRALGEHQRGDGPRRAWPTTNEDAELALRARAEDDRGPNNGAPRVLENLDEARNEVVRLYREIETFNAEFERRGGWARFFLVDGGHIHSSRACSTCRPTTRFGWLPDLSGSTEAAAVAAHGPLLCTVCFPSAPTEWTMGKPKKPQCKGTGGYPARASVTEYGMRKYARCPECGERFQLTPLGKFRAHPPKKDNEAG